MNATALIGVDWGSTNLRAFRFAADGSVAERRESPRGAAGLRPDAFAGVLAETLAGWDTRGGAPILLAGMVGSRAGWREAPYLACPVDRAALAGHTLPLDTPLGPAWLVPGVATAGAGRVPSVMRGEETQILGAGIADGVVVLPGTHSKWATLAGGRIVEFATAMTGELYALLRRHSLLGQLAETDAPFDAAAFAAGVGRSLAGPGLVATLFSARAGVLLGELAPAAVESYLSGLLIGAEVVTFGAAVAALIGAPRLAGLYATAFRLAGAAEPALIDGDEAAARGLWRIGEKL